MTVGHGSHVKLEHIFLIIDGQMNLCIYLFDLYFVAMTTGKHLVVLLFNRVMFHCERF